MDSERQNQNSQINFGKKNDDIKIQENLFEDSSKDHPELPSHNASLMEAHEYKKFSIEDFKMLDKRKLLTQKELMEDDFD